MYSQNELLKKIKMDVYKNVKAKYSAEDLDERFNIIYSSTASFHHLMARVQRDGLTEYLFEDYSEYNDIFVAQITIEVLDKIKKTPTKTVGEYLSEVKEKVFNTVVKNGKIDASVFGDSYYSSENYELMEKSVKRRADSEGLIHNDDFDILIAGDATAIISELTE
jgi:hypothetical protein